MQDETTTLAVVGEIYRRLGVAGSVTLTRAGNRFYYVFGRNCPHDEFRAIEKCNLDSFMVDRIAKEVSGRSCVVIPWYDSAARDVDRAWHAINDAFESITGKFKYSPGYSYKETGMHGMHGMYVGRMFFGYRIVFVVYLDESGLSAPAGLDSFVPVEEAFAALDGID